MIPHYSKIHNKFKINGISYLRENLWEVAYSHLKEGLSFEKTIGSFLLDWLNDKDYVLVKTSGSTGTPKTVRIKKQAMVHSAIATGDYFNLKPGNSALHCLPTDFIAGKMMLVRAMVLGLQLDIVVPSSSQSINTKKSYDFCAMVPMQVESSFKQLHKIKTLIIGGAPIPAKLLVRLQGIKTNAYATYGMTETITHIAVKQLNNNDKITLSSVERSSFRVFPNISISQDSRDCLVIEAAYLFDGKVVTNDIVKIHSESTFEFLGRYDNVINSGGIKLFPEQIEARLSEIIPQRFFITSEPDERLGEKVVLVIEGGAKVLPKSVFDTLDSYEKPKSLYSIKEFIETSSGKVRRKETLARATKN